jgi:hypothetical protein
MAITVVPKPVTVSWSDFNTVDSLPVDEDAHIDMGYEVENKSFRRVGGQFMVAETLEVRVKPLAKVLRSASQTGTLLAHEQGHYDIGILAARALARELALLHAATPAALGLAMRSCFTLHTVTRLDPVQKKYDKDTGHGTNAQEQARWAGLISAALAAVATMQLDGLPL